MKEIKVQCPFCCGTEFIDGKISAYSGVSVKFMNGAKNGAVYAAVCRDCGSIVRWYISDVEKLLPKKEDRTDK